MELIGSIFLILALALVVGLFISRPFLQKNPAEAGTSEAGEMLGEAAQRDHQRSALLAERDRVLNALQDLDFDYALGKVPQEDYPLQRAALMKNGADVLRRLDAIQGEHEAISSAAAASVEERIESAVATRRADARQGAGPQTGAAHPVDAAQPVGAEADILVTEPHASGSSRKDRGSHSDPLEEVIAARKRKRNESSAGFCPRCGKPVQKSDKFCSRCGTTL